MLSQLKSKSKRGFTLIEILIVVVIIGILAALMLPKILSQPKRAAIAEAVQTLGALRRAQVSYKATAGDYLDVTGPTDSNWSRLGMGPLNTNAAKFTYSCLSGHCAADALGSLAPGHMNIWLDKGTLGCGEGYKEVTSPSVASYNGQSGGVVSCTPI